MNPRGATGVPPRGDGQGGGHSRGRRGASTRIRDPPDEGQEDARGAYPSPSGSLSGEMLTLDFGPLALGPRRVHLALMYEW